jgi:hypothetical protein
MGDWGIGNRHLELGITVETSLTSLTSDSSEACFKAGKPNALTVQGPRMSPKTALALGALASAMTVAGCGPDDIVNPVDNPPSDVTLVQQGSARQFGPAYFGLSAKDDKGLARAILDYGDNTKKDTLALVGTSASVNPVHTYASNGNFVVTATVQDNAGQATNKTLLAAIGVDTPPAVVVSSLAGLESKVSQVPLSSIVKDAEGDAFSASFTPISSDLRVSLAQDTLKYWLADQDANGSRVVRVRVDYSKGGVAASVEQDLTIVFATMDDISGTVRDLYKDGYLSTLLPSVVMQGPYTGWARLVTGTDSMQVAVGADGSFSFPKVTSAAHLLRTFITNGSASSYIATQSLAAGDRVVDATVFTNAGTDGTGTIDLTRYLNNLMRKVNFNLLKTGTVDVLNGMDLKNHSNEIVVYLAGKDSTYGSTAFFGWTPAQQAYLENHIQSKILDKIEPGKRPRIVKGTPTEALPWHVEGSYITPNMNTILLFASHSGNPGQISLYDNNKDGVFEGSIIRILIDYSNTPPYGMNLYSLNQEVLSAFCGDGDVYDQTLGGKTDFLEGGGIYIGGDVVPSGDLKFLNLLTYETPSITNKIVERFFGLP